MSVPPFIAIHPTLEIFHSWDTAFFYVASLLLFFINDYVGTN